MIMANVFKLFGKRYIHRQLYDPKTVRGLMVLSRIARGEKGGVGSFYFPRVCGMKNYRDSYRTFQDFKWMLIFLLIPLQLFALVLTFSFATYSIMIFIV